MSDDLADLSELAKENPAIKEIRALAATLVGYDLDERADYEAVAKSLRALSASIQKFKTDHDEIDYINDQGGRPAGPGEPPKLPDAVYAWDDRYAVTFKGQLYEQDGGEWRRTDE